MSDQSRSNDPGSLWRGQPEEKLPVDLERVVSRRTGELYSSTRWEIVTSIAAAVVLIAVVAWRLWPGHGGLLEFGLTAAVVWLAVSLFWFRHRIWRRDPPRPDAVALSGVEYYRAELERRRDHLRNEWLWHGPLALGAIILVAVLTGRTNMVFQPLRNVVPLLLLLAAWTAFGIWRRRLQARELQREIDEIRPAQQN